MSRGVSMKGKQGVDDVIFAKAMRRGANYRLIAMVHGVDVDYVLKVMLKRGVVASELR